MKERPILFSAPMVRAIIAGTKTQTRRVMNPQPVHAQVYEWKGEVVYDAEHRLWWWKDRSFENLIDFFGDQAELAKLSPYGKPGDRLWVKETHAFFSIDAFKYLDGPLATLGLRAYGGAPLTPGCNLRWHTGDAMVDYAAHPTSPEELRSSPGFSTWRSNTPDRWRPSIFMPRWASRITLEVTGVRVERLHDITELDALAEGATPYIYGHGPITEEGIAADPGIRSPSMYRAGFEQLWREINGDESWDQNPFVWVVEFKHLT